MRTDKESLTNSLLKLRFGVIRAFNGEEEYWDEIEKTINVILQNQFVQGERLLYYHMKKIEKRLGDIYCDNAFVLKDIVLVDLKIVCDIYLGDEK